MGTFKLSVSRKLASLNLGPLQGSFTSFISHFSIRKEWVGWECLRARLWECQKAGIGTLFEGTYASGLKDLTKLFLTLPTIYGILSFLLNFFLVLSMKKILPVNWTEDPSSVFCFSVMNPADCLKCLNPAELCRR